MVCKICSSTTHIIFNKKLLTKYLVGYHQCSNCGFIQTDEPHWLSEAYQNAITSLDLGYAGRNTYSSYITAGIIELFFNYKDKFIDYGGGYGLFVRLMRDCGYDYYLEDKYCQNLFANSFEQNEIPEQKFELLTAFEVFEHLPDPISEISTMLEYSDSILFSTEIYPSDKSELENWWYISPETGQHVSIYSIKSLQEIAKHFRLNLYTNGTNLHLLTPKTLNSNIFRLICKYKFSFLYLHLLKPKRQSLLITDYNKIKSGLHAPNENYSPL